jgi:hypothetical protein
MLRVYGRVLDAQGNVVPDENGYNWRVVTTAPNGDNSEVYLTALCQNIKLNLNEAPFNANCGIPAVPSVISQVFPDFYMVQIQAQFSQYFASLLISKLPGRTPIYNVTCTTFAGAVLTAQVAQ